MIMEEITNKELSYIFQCPICGCLDIEFRWFPDAISMECPVCGTRHT